MPIDAAYLLETLKQSIRINSVVPVEEKLSEFIADELRGLGVEPKWHEIAPGRPNVYAMADRGPADDILLLTGHLDTVDVAANWETDPFTPVEKDGRLYGLGSFDMKSGLIQNCGYLDNVPVQHTRLRAVTDPARHRHQQITFDRHL